jgi:hypothetical protein
MSGGNTSLGSELGNKEEVEAVLIGILNQVSINDRSRGRVDEVLGTFLSFNEESLVDSLVNNYEGDGRNILSVINLLNDFLELSDLLSNNLISHLLTNTVSENNNLVRHVIVVHLLEVKDGVLKASVELGFNQFLEFRLDNIIIIIFVEIFVQGSAETDN